MAAADGSEQLVVDTVALDDIALGVTQYTATPDHFVGASCAKIGPPKVFTCPASHATRAVY